MDTQKIINRVVGTEGILRIPSWWMHKILSDLVKYCEENEGASVTIKEYVESQLNLVGKTIEDLDTRLENIESHELFEIVSELPSEPKDNTIYLIPSQNGEGNNVLTEWAYINGTWEQFGEFNANVDLSEYAKKEALDELSAEVNEVAEKIENISPTPMVSVTYAELKALRDNGELVAGMQYRITDYVTTTIQENTRSAGHQIDVIVTADNENTLNEVARTCLHDGDTYFSEHGAKLEAWQIWYSLDNDTEKFAWADAQNGKGVIYRMIDEWNNDCPYDFKNIQFKRNLTFENGYAEFSAYGEETWVYTFAGQSYHINNDEWSDMLDGSLESPFGHMSDENTSTFHDNIIKPYIMVYNGNDIYTECGVRYLNDMVFLGYWEKIGSANDEDMPYYYAYCCYSNSFGANCYSNSFGANCNSNSFGNYCCANSFGNYCYNNSLGNGCGFNSLDNNCNYNSFGNSCYSNSFGNDCCANSFGNNCYHNSFGNNCYNNSLGEYCYYNSFGDDCNSNSFGNNCNYNSFGNSCYSNSFGDDCYVNSFGNYCYSNSFGNNCYNNSFGEYCYYNSFGDDCNSNSFGNNCHDNSFGNYCYEIRFANPNDDIGNGHYFRYNSFEHNVFDFSLVDDNEDSATIDSPIQYYHVCSGVSETSVVATQGNYAKHTIAKNSKGEIKIYCEADLIA